MMGLRIDPIPLLWAAMPLVFCAALVGCTQPVEPTAGTEVVRRLGRMGVVMVTTNCGTGSGFFFANEGDVYVMTNDHVVSAGHTSCEPTRVAVETKNANRRDAVVVFNDSTADIAVLKVFETDLQPDFEISALVLSNSAPFPQQQILVWGSPYGEGLVPLDGLVTSLLRSRVPVLETNVSVQPGNSGGPVLDARTGLVLGVVQSRSQDIAGDQGVSAGASYAVRADFVRELLQSVDWKGVRAKPLPLNASSGRGSQASRPTAPIAPPLRPPMIWIVHGMQIALMRAAALTPALYAGLTAVWLLVIGRPIFFVHYLAGAALLAYAGDRLFQSGSLTVLGDYAPILSGPAVALLGVMLGTHLLLRAFLALHLFVTGEDAGQSRSARIATGLVFRPWVALPLITIILSSTWIFVAWALVWNAGKLKLWVG